MSQQITKIIVHPGLFHADDVCVVAWLRHTGCDAPVERRIPTPDELNDPAVLVADIGGRHEPSLNNFDHHQKGGAGERWDSWVPYAAFGLVYDTRRPTNKSVDTRFHSRVVEPVDAADCGWHPTLEVTPDGGQLRWVPPKVGMPLPPNKPAQSLTLSAIISGFNPGAGASSAERDAAFFKAVEFAQQVLGNELRAIEEFVAAKDAVMTAKTEGAVLVLEQFVPWTEHVFERPDADSLLYVVFPSERGGWLCQQVPKAAGSFEGRKPLPAAWAGLRGAALAELTGLSAVGDATFCHPGRFICGGETKEDAMRLASLACADA